MSKSRRDVDFVMDIQDAILRILEYSAALDWETYLSDYKTQDAVVRNLEIIGEAAKNVSIEMRQEFPAIPWKMMAGTRDRLMHQILASIRKLFGRLCNLTYQRYYYRFSQC